MFIDLRLIGKILNNVMQVYMLCNISSIVVRFKYTIFYPPYLIFIISKLVYILMLLKYLLNDALGIHTHVNILYAYLKKNFIWLHHQKFNLF